MGSNPLSFPVQIISMWRSGQFAVVMSPQILQEIVAKLLEKGVSEDQIEDFVELVGRIALHIPGSYESNRLDHIDPEDNMFLAASFESNADYIVSYDAKSLLPMKYFHVSQIVLPALFVRALLADG